MPADSEDLIVPQVVPADSALRTTTRERRGASYWQPEVAGRNGGRKYSHAPVAKPNPQEEKPGGAQRCLPRTFQQREWTRIR